MNPNFLPFISEFKKIIFFRFKMPKEWLHLTVSCFLSYLAYSLSGFAWLSLVSFVPFLFALRKFKKGNKTFFFGFFFGAVFFAINTFWIFSVLPLKWLGIYSLFSGFVSVVFFFLLYTILFGIIFGLWTKIYVVITTPYRGIIEIILGAMLWVVAEYAAANIIGTVSFSYPGPNGIFGNIGTPLADIPYLLRFAEIGGMSMLSLFVIIVNLSLASILSDYPEGKKNVPVFLLFVLFLFPLFIPVMHSKSSNQRIIHSAIFTTAIHSSDRDSYSEVAKYNKNMVVENLKKMIEQDKKFDLIVFPEKIGIFLSIDPSTRLALLKGVLSEDKGVAVDSDMIIQEKDSPPKNILRYYNANGIIVAVSEKRILVPFGEHIPSMVKRLFPLIGLKNWLIEMNKVRIFSSPSQEALFGMAPISGGGKIATFFCSEILSQNLYSAAVKQGAEILVNISSQAILKGDRRYFWRTVQWSKIHAVTHRRSFVMAGNFSPSVAINPDGYLFAMAPSGLRVSNLQVDIPVEEKLTFFDKMGFDWVLSGSFLISIAFFINLVIRDYRKNIG